MTKNKDKIWIVALICGIVILVAPYLYTILYAVPSSDDFVMAVGVDTSNLFNEAIRVANEYYLKWAGDWISIFLQILINPLLLFGATSSMYGVEMAILFLLYTTIMGWMIRNIFYYVLKIKDIKVILGVYLIVLMCILNMDVWTEIFYWFVGSTYLQGMLFGMSAIALLVEYRAKGGMICGVLLSVMGFFGCSFFMLAVLPATVYLIYIVVDFIKDRKIYWEKDIPFIFYCAGFLSALVAPGNFSRLGSETGESGLHLFRTVLDTLILWLDTTFDLVKNPLILIAMFLLVLIGVAAFREMKFDFKYPVIPFALTLICLYITYFPIALGYGGTRYLPNRVRFIFCTYAVLMYTVSFLYLGGWVYRKKEELVTKKNLLTAAVGLAFFGYVCIMPTQYYEELPYAQTVAQIQSVKNANSDWMYMLRYIEASEEEDLFLSRSKINTVIIKAPGLTGDENYVVNRKIAEYFGKNSIKLELW